MVVVVTSGAGFAGGMGAITVVRTTLVTTGTYPSAYIANDPQMIATCPTHRRLRQPDQQAQQLQPRRRCPLVVVRTWSWLRLTKRSAEDVCLIQSAYRLGSRGHLGVAGWTSNYSSSNIGVAFLWLTFLQAFARIGSLYMSQISRIDR